MGNTTSKSKPAASKRCRLTEVKDTAEHIGSFLEAPDLAKLCRASKNTQLLFSKNLPAMKLLKAVFDADPKLVKEILRKPRLLKSKCIVLTKTHIKETYFSQKLNKTGVKREWTNISPLEAAAWCGDIFLVRELLLYVPLTQKQEAANQLKRILHRKESEQNGTYLAPYRALIQAYETYDGQYNALNQQDNWTELKKLWNEVWQRQRLLPTYGLQEYCNDILFDPVPSFTEPPKRSCYLYCTPKFPLDLDDSESFFFGEALYKGSTVGHEGARGVRVELFPWGAFYDLAAIRRLIEVRTIELCNLVKYLEGPELYEEPDFEENDEKKATV